MVSFAGRYDYRGEGPAAVVPAQHGRFQAAQERWTTWNAEGVRTDGFYRFVDSSTLETSEDQRSWIRWRRAP